MRISKLALGTVQLGIEYSIYPNSGKPTYDQSIALLNYAVNSGINTLDTARIYGESENIIGDYINSKADKPVNVVTKFKISDRNLTHPERARKEAFDSIQTSLACLDLARVPIAIYHHDRHQPIELVMKVLPEVLHHLVEEGLIQYGGVSVYHPGDARYTLEYQVIKVLQIPLNVFDQRIMQNNLLNQLKQGGKFVFVRSVFLKGLFFMQKEHLYQNLPLAVPYLQKLQNIASIENMSIAQLAFSFVRNMSGVNSIVIGVDNGPQLEENLKLLNGPRLDRRLRQALENEFCNVEEKVITPGLWPIKR